MLDASFLVDLLLGRTEVVETLAQMDGDGPLLAPELIEPETLNALRGLARAAHISDDRASQAVVYLSELRLLRYPHGPLRRRVWELRHNLTPYDATYVSLAEALGDCVLLTRDRALAKTARRVLGAERVRRV